MFNTIKYSKILLLSLPVILVVIIACNKKKEQVFSGAYKPALETPIKFDRAAPVPALGKEGDTVRFKVVGVDSLSKVFNVNPGAVIFKFNGVVAEVRGVNVSDSTISVVIPANASSGAASMLVNDNTFFGPQFRIIGNVRIDSTFNVGITDQQGRRYLGTGPNNRITDMFYEKIGNDEYAYIMGPFTTYNGETTYQSVYNNQVDVVSSTRYILKMNLATGAIRTDFQKGLGPNGPVNGILPINQFQGYIVYGANFSVYNSRDGVNNMTRIYYDGRLDSVVQNVFNPDPYEHPEWSMDTMPAFIGGYNSAIRKVFLDSRGRLISIGNFSAHQRNRYELSTATSVNRLPTWIQQISAQDQNGIVDMTYNYDPTRRIYTGANGSITDAVQILGNGTPYGKIIVVGAFTSWNGVSKNRIMMLDDNGQPDPSFNASANGTITKITYNSATRKLLVMGSFTEFNGMPATAGLVMLTEDGNIDPSFQLGEIQRSNSTFGQIITYAGQLSDGKIILAGNFDKYRDASSESFITRQNFMILDANGDLSPGLNNTGSFSGEITSILETTAPGRTGGTVRAVILAGDLNLFDNTQVANFIKIALQ